jgi:hypothetical protein
MIERVESNLERGAIVLAALLEALDGDAHALADPYAEAVLETARSAAGGHPTPQSRMAAAGLLADRGRVIAPPGSIVTGSGGRPVSLGEIVSGAEWGSSTYPQFAPRNTRGYWLGPAFDADSTLRAGDAALEEIVRNVTR